MKICDKEKCTGCGACYNACLQKCITMEYNIEGFLYPQINENNCIKCNKCKRVCPSINERSLSETSICYAGKSNNDITVEKSTSGGIAYELSKYFIENNNLVCGAIYNNGIVQHKLSGDLEELKSFSGSKYVQSEIGNSYTEIKKALQIKKVLFIGTPCQVAGLLNIVNKKERENLYVIDILCHGVPSMKSLNAFIGEVTSGIDSKNNVSVRFRTNGVNTEIRVGNSKIYDKNYDECCYYMGFMRGLFNRISCYNCRYACQKRIGDISLGDFWGLKNSYIDVKKGISLILVNSKKGKELIDKISKFIIVEERDVADAIAGNKALKYPTQLHRKRKEYFKLVNKIGFKNTVRICLWKEFLYFKLIRLSKKVRDK